MLLIIVALLGVLYIEWISLLGLPNHTPLLTSDDRYWLAIGDFNAYLLIGMCQIAGSIGTGGG
jgi:hypothetical protein